MAVTSAIPILLTIAEMLGYALAEAVRRAEVEHRQLGASEPTTIAAMGLLRGDLLHWPPTPLRTTRRVAAGFLVGPQIRGQERVQIPREG